MNYLDLFHGIGGFALGAYWAGMKFDNHFCSDIEPYTQELYKLRFPDSIQLGDITKINTDELKKIPGEWIITGGFPCQDISIAGKGAGIHGERSGLWFEYWRFIRDLRPRFAIMENVGMLIHRGLREVLGSLAEIGYDAEWQDIRAEDVGAPHKRERIWIVAYPRCEHGEREKKLQEYERTNRKRNAIKPERSIECDRKGVDEMAHPESGEPWQQTKREGGKDSCGGSEEIPNSENIGIQRSEAIGKQESRTYAEKGILRSDNSRYGAGYWSTEPDVGRLANGISRRVDRLKGLGNSIVPQIAEILFNQIKDKLNAEKTN